MTRRVEINYVVETETAINIVQEEQQAEQHDIHLIGKGEFVEKCNNYKLKSDISYDKLWNRLMGNYPAEGRIGIHPQVHFLTEESCETILQHLHQFQVSGLDYQNLPAGFFLTRNPVEGHGRDVLHFNGFLAKNTTLKKPLAITLSDKNACQAQINAHLTFEFPKLQWYQFLVNLANKPKDFCPCTQKQLDDAFIYFVNQVEAHGLKFFKADFSMLKDANPIVLLARWSTVIFNRHLKMEDKESQWKVLPELPLENSYGAIRAITDQMHTKSPCGFLLPEMGFEKVLLQDLKNYNYSKTYIGYHSVKGEEHIRDELTFWRYIAFMPKRNTIKFYRKTLKHLDELPQTLERGGLLRMLAAATTGYNHQAGNLKEEKNELSIWQGICKLINQTNNFMMVKALESFSYRGQFQQVFVNHLTSLDKQPNIEFLNAMANHITHNLQSDVFNQLAGRGSKLVELSNKLRFCVRNHETGLYQGCRFYLVEGHWKKLGVRSYTELAYEISENVNQRLAEVIIPNISTFGITKVSELAEIGQDVDISDDLVEKLSFFSTLFKEVKQSLNVKQLNQIFKELENPHYDSANPLEMLSYFEQNFKNHFEPEYFDKKRSLIGDAINGLNHKQIALLEEYQFEQHDIALLIQIESALVRKQPLISNDSLMDLNDQFMALTDILMPSEFSEFLNRLATLRDNMPGDISSLRDLLSHVIKHKSLASFNVIFLRNKREKIDDDSLLPKINLYIETEKYITQNSWSISPILLQEMLATLILKLPKDAISKENNAYKLTTIIENLNNIVALHPHAQQQAINLINNLEKGEGNYFDAVNNALTHLDRLTKILSPGTDKLGRDNMSVFYSLVSHYQTKPADLIKFLETFTGLEDEHRHFFLSFVAQLLNSGQSLVDFQELVERCRSCPEKMMLLETYCKVPPYASLEQLCDWLDEENFEDQYKRFSLSPYEKRHQTYMFNVHHYYRQKELFNGVADDVFTDALGQRFSELLRAKRSQSMDALRSVVEGVKLKSEFDEKDLQDLLTTTIEILARTAHQSDSSSPTGRCSQEFNTTQVMAAYAMLQKGLHDKRIMNQVDTGEGKSRLMMVLSACQAIQGNTVDFITSNLILAERDYFTYQAFFTALDIPTGLISLNTPPQLYRTGGVNFSDNSSLILLRNKSDIDLQPFNFLDEEKSRRCLTLDEGDKFIHDKSSHAFNFAAKSKSLAGYVWVYPLLVAFMQETKNDSKQVKDDSALFDAFLKYVSLHDNDEMHQASLDKMKKKNPKQLKVWLQSALTALNLKPDIDYVVTSADEKKLVPVRNIEGITCYTRLVLVSDNGRPMEGSNFSDGVHQCICAIENQKAGKEVFVILPENETQRTIYAYPFLNTYDRVYGMSGSTRAEAPMANPEINLHRWQYMITPREKLLRREDRRVLAAKDEQQQISVIKREIVEACKNGQPFLLVCRSDKQSKFIFEQIQKDEKCQSLVKRWQHVHGLTSSQDEKEAVEKAGQSGVVTFSSSGMFSRGVDIRAENLKVRAAFIPTVEDEIQIKGRTGRFGKEGDYRMVINLKDEDNPIDGRTYNIEARVREAQYTMALSASIEEKTASMYAEFLEKVHQAFLKQFKETDGVDQKNVLIKWQKFLDQMQKDWEVKRQDMTEALDNQELPKFKEQFSNFVNLWRHQMRAQVTQKTSITLPIKFANDHFNCIQAHRGFFAEQVKKRNIEPKLYYDIADDGQATIYKIPFAQTMATLRGERPLFANTRAWWEGRGVLFPDLRATLNGERPLFANLRAFIGYLWDLLTNCFKKENDLSGEKAIIPSTA